MIAEYKDQSACVVFFVLNLWFWFDFCVCGFLFVCVVGWLVFFFLNLTSIRIGKYAARPNTWEFLVS